MTVGDEKGEGLATSCLPTHKRKKGNRRGWLVFYGGFIPDMLMSAPLGLRTAGKRDG